ncbi:CCR4-Not complex component, Not1-domain-containing protein [Sporodiniella umbellata]|nr:CCR4-Not complex component, Not1-domain-containing protein [Sporodiniella umbellata]
MTDNKDTERTEGRICKIILEGGYESCSSASRFRELLSDITDFTEKEIAEAIGHMVRTQSNMTSVGSQTREATWRVDNFVLCIKEAAPTLNWTAIFQYLDCKHFFLYGTKDLDILIDIWKACPQGNNPFPASVFFGQWKNLKGQLSALYQMANASTDYVNLPDSSKRKVIEAFDFTTASSLNKSLANQLVKEQLNSLDLIECVIKLADTSVIDDVKVFLEMMVNKSPELVFMGLLQIDPIANKVHEDLFARLIVYYFTGNTHSVFVFTKFWKAKPELFKKNIVELYNNDPTALTRILAFVHELKILPSILDLQSFLFTIDLAALAARREYLNLEKWLLDKSNEHGEAFSKTCLAFLSTKVRAELSRQDSQMAPMTVPLSVDTVNIFTKVLADSTKEKEMVHEIQSRYIALSQKGSNETTPETAVKKVSTKAPGLPTSNVTFKQDIEDEANSYYEKIYSGEISIEGMIEKLRMFSQSKDSRENDVYACMLHNLLDEYNFFPKYPEKELTITSILFGQLIQHRLFAYSTLGLALRYVLDALGHVPGTKIYRFGLTALTQFQARLPEWPQYCFHLTQAPALQLTNPEMVSMVKSAMHIGKIQQQRTQQPPQPNIAESQALVSLPPTSTSNNFSLEKQKTPLSQATIFTAVFVPNISNSTNENIIYETPNEPTQDKILFIINNVAHNNLETKASELKELLKKSSYLWFSSYLVVKRASIEPNYHDLYILLLKLLDSPLLYQHMIRETFFNIKILLNSDNTVSSSTERTLLKNLGAWLGDMTLAQNVPIKQKCISFKELLLEGYDTGRLIVIIPFVCKVLEQGKKNSVFVPPNPWVMAILRLLVELYQNAELKLNLKFEIEVLCKTLSIELNTIQPTQTLKSRKQRQLIQTTGMAVKPENSLYPMSRPPITNLISQIPSPAPLPVGADKAEEEFIQLPNLGPYLTFNSQIALYASQPNSKRWVLQAVKQSIFDIIGPVVERSVAIASVSTRELILKDFAVESDEKKIRKAAHLMAESLAGSLAMVTCKEPLHTSMATHLRSIFVANGLSEVAAEQAATLTATENLDLVCTVIEKTAMEKVIAEVDEVMAMAYNSRKKHRERDGVQPYFDMDIFSVSRYSATLPEPLRPKPNGLQANQLRVYEDFIHIPRVAPHAINGQMVDPSFFEQQQPLRSSLSANTNMSHHELHAGFNSSLPTSMDQQQQQASAHQTLERFAQCIGELEKFINVTNLPSFSAIPHQHDIFTVIHQIPLLAMASFDKAEAARTFAQKVVQLLYKCDTQLGREVYVVLLERLCEVSPNVGVLVTSWLTHADDERKYNVPVTVALIKANLINLPEQDQELANLIDSGRASAVDFTARLIFACLFEENSLATRQEFIKSLEALNRFRGNMPESVMILVEEMRRRSATGNNNPGTVILNQPSILSQNLSDEEINVREQMHVLFSEWVRLYQHPTSTEKILRAFVTQLSQQNIFKMEEMSSLFYRVCIEASVDHATTHKQLPNQPVGLIYLPIDAFSKLIVCFMELPQLSASEPAENDRVNLFKNVLSIIALTISQVHEQRQQQFDQRPFLRLFTSLLCELHTSEQQLQKIYMSLLSAMSNTLSALQPSQFPGFTFAWLQLISHRLFMPKLLLAENQKGWPTFQKLLMHLFQFLNPFLQIAKLKETTRMLYRGTLRVLLVLLHDFPEFLCDYHYSFCDVIPASCIQLRNLILSAFPRHMRLPDPFTPNLKVDLLPDINQPPSILSDYTSVLKTDQLKQEIDDMMKPQADKTKLFHSLSTKLLNKEPSDTKYNVSLINALVFYVGVTGVTEGIPVNQGSPIQIFQYLLNELDSEGRYLFLSAIANQLRYPNSHTHYFSCVILYLFAEGNQEIIKEQITRVLLERLIVNRPHPWGLLITFIELIKNPRYSFWNHSFTRCATDIERLFESVSRSINQN